MDKRIPLATPHMGGSEMKYVQDAFDKNWIAPLGENVNELERLMASYLGNEHALATSCGTAAIHLGLKELNVQQGDIVFCSTLTFSASCNPIVYEKATPVFIDSDESWNMSPKALRNAFEWAKAEGKMPKAVVVVDLYGQSAKWDEILEICNEYNVPVLEDAAEALGASYKGKMCGSFGHMNIISFNGNKIITTSGGGMLVSESEEDMKKAIFWATQAREQERHYEHKEIGYNYRMSNIVAGIGRGQLLHLDEHVALKKKIYDTYKEAFADIEDIEMNPIPENCEANYWLSCITLKPGCKVTPLDIMVALEKENIESRPIWKPMHLQPVYKENDFVTTEEKASVGEDIFNRGVCLPSDIKMTEEDIQKVINIIKSL